MQYTQAELDEAYQAACKKETVPVFNARVNLVGLRGSGKTSFLNKLMGKAFKEDIQSTEGISIHHIKSKFKMNEKTTEEWIEKTLDKSSFLEDFSPVALARIKTLSIKTRKISSISWQDFKAPTKINKPRNSGTMKAQVSQEENSQRSPNLSWNVRHGQFNIQQDNSSPTQDQTAKLTDEYTEEEEFHQDESNPETKKEEDISIFRQKGQISNKVQKNKITSPEMQSDETNKDKNKEGTEEETYRSVSQMESQASEQQSDDIYMQVHNDKEAHMHPGTTGTGTEHLTTKEAAESLLERKEVHIDPGTIGMATEHLKIKETVEDQLERKEVHIDPGTTGMATEHLKIKETVENQLERKEVHIDPGTIGMATEHLKIKETVEDQLERKEAHIDHEITGMATEHLKTKTTAENLLERKEARIDPGTIDMATEHLATKEAAENIFERKEAHIDPRTTGMETEHLVTQETAENQLERKIGEGKEDHLKTEVSRKSHSETCPISTLEEEDEETETPEGAGVRKEMLNFEKTCEEGKPFSSTFWNFSGQNDFVATHHLFLDAESTTLIIMDITKPLDQNLDTIPKLGHSSSPAAALHSWLNSLCGKKLQATVALVLTHNDMIKDDNIEKYVDTYINGILNTVQGHPYANLITKDNIHLVDNKLGSDKAFQNLRNQLLEYFSRQGSWGKQIPLRWIKLKADMIEKTTKERKGYMPLKSVIAEAKRYRIDEKEIEAFLRIQNTIGDFVYFPDPGLREIIFTDSKWFVEKLKDSITMNVTMDSLKEIWKGIEVEFLEQFIKMLKKTLNLTIPVDEPDQPVGQHFQILNRIANII